jgi:polyisoprenoid-binding protein YceI
MAKWLINSNHSAAQFAVRHMMVSWVPGLFNKISGTIRFDPLKVETTTVEVEIDAAAIFTGVADRDNHLRSPDFLEVEKYPTITFKSTGIELAGLDQALVHGELTMRGVTRPVTLDVRWTGPAHFDDEGKLYTSFGFRAETVISRADFGMAFNTAMENGGFMVGKHVYLTLNVEADLAED